MKGMWKMTNAIIVERGDIFEVDLGFGVGSEQQNSRPCLIIQNDMGNKYSPTVIVAIITSQVSKKKMPTHVEIPKDNENNLNFHSVVTLEQIRTVDKRRLKMKIGRCSDEVLEKIDKAILVSTGVEVQKTENKDTYRKQSNYPVPQRFQQEIFDIRKVKRISRTINELERNMVKYKLTNNSNVDLYELKNDIKEYLMELKNYCGKFGKDYQMFYTPVSDVVYSKGDGVIARAI